MNQLTDAQITALQSLSLHPLIYSVGVEFFNNGLSHITITSAINANWDGSDGVDALLVRELDKHFPDLEYMGSPAKFYNTFTEMDEEIYSINFEGETLIRLVIQSEHVAWAR